MPFSDKIVIIIINNGVLRDGCGFSRCCVCLYAPFFLNGVLRRVFWMLGGFGR